MCNSIRQLYGLFAIIFHLICGFLERRSKHFIQHIKLLINFFYHLIVWDPVPRAYYYQTPYHLQTTIAYLLGFVDNFSCHSWYRNHRQIGRSRCSESEMTMCGRIYIFPSLEKCRNKIYCSWNLK